jgi:hypothetical protein
MNRIERRTRANFERLYGMYPFGCGDKGMHEINFERAKTHDLVSYTIVNDMDVGDPSCHFMDVAKLREMLKHLNEYDMKSLRMMCRINFPDAAKWIDDELEQRHASKGCKREASAKRNIEAAVKSGALRHGAARH